VVCSESSASINWLNSPISESTADVLGNQSADREIANSNHGIAKSPDHPTVAKSVGRQSAMAPLAVHKNRAAPKGRPARR
jgi:hypothetical protein